MLNESCRFLQGFLDAFDSESQIWQLLWKLFRVVLLRIQYVDFVTNNSKINNCLSLDFREQFIHLLAPGWPFLIKN